MQEADQSASGNKEQRMRKVTTLLMLFTASVAFVGAASGEDPGLEKGEKAPSFALKDHSGKMVKLEELLKKGPVAMVFYRSATW